MSIRSFVSRWPGAGGGQALVLAREVILLRGKTIITSGQRLQSRATLIMAPTAVLEELVFLGD